MASNQRYRNERGRYDLQEERRRYYTSMTGVKIHVYDPDLEVGDNRLSYPFYLDEDSVVVIQQFAVRRPPVSNLIYLRRATYRALQNLDDMGMDDRYINLDNTPICHILRG